jgi:hypothetical protein
VRWATEDVRRRRPLRGLVLALLIATAGALALGGAYFVVAAVPPLSDSALRQAAAPAAAVTPPDDGAAPQAALAAATDGVLPPKTPGRPRVVVLGDTFTAGADGFAGNTWPELVCQRLGCEYVPLFTVPGAGFTQPGADGRTLGDRLDEVAAAQPDVVVVAGGSWDIGVPQPVLRGAVNQLLYRLERKLPDVRTVVLSPFYPSAPAPFEVSLVRSTVYNGAAKRGLPFLDVTDLFDAAHTGLISLDGSAPTYAGQTYLADVVTPFVEPALSP